MHGLDAFFATVKLPSISQVTQALIKTLNNENSSIQDISDIMAQDPALLAKLLRLANSAQFGLPRGVASIDEAIQMVGLAKVRSLSLGASLCNIFPALPGLNQQTFWHSSMACATYAQWLATALDMDVQLAWLTGMMQRLGELLIGQANPHRRWQRSRRCRTCPVAAGNANGAWSAFLKARSAPNWHAAGTFRCRLCRHWNALTTRWWSRPFPDWGRCSTWPVCWRTRRLPMPRPSMICRMT
jgi:hypothetical protein